MSELITLRYQFDPTGRAPTNLIVDEPHTVPQTGTRLIVAREGLFYTPGFIIRPANNSNHLQEGVDYRFVAMDADITALTGIQTGTAIEFINPSAWGDFLITYQCVGGHEGRSNALIEELIEAIENAKDHPVEWTHIQNKPAQFPPSEHWHEVQDLTGWEVMVDGLRELQRAIVESRPLHLSSRELHHQDQRILYILCQLRHDLNRISDYMGRFDATIGRLILEIERLGDLPQRVSDLESRVQALEDVDHETMIWTLIEKWHILNGCGDGSGGWVPGPTDIIDMYLVNGTPVAGPGEIVLPFIIDCVGEGDAPVTETGGVTETPTIMSPSEASNWVNQLPVFQASPFSGTDKDGNSSQHSASYWQIAIDPAFTMIRYQTGKTTVHLDTLDPNVANINLTSGSYYVRVGYVSDSGATSNWSEIVQFSITAIEVESPDIIMPVNGDVGVDLTPTITASDFVTSGTSTHSASQWQIATDSSFGSPVLDVTDSDALTSLVASAALDPQTTHYVRVRYRSSNNSWSPWSQVVSFTTRSS